ncbi:unnamed protein product, partial [Cryptosporidium hominis]
SRDLQNPLLAFPLPTNQLAVATQLYDENFQEKWVLRNGFSGKSYVNFKIDLIKTIIIGYVPNIGVQLNGTIASPVNIKTPFDQFNKNDDSNDEETVVSDINEEQASNEYLIPVDQNKIENGGTLSFNITINNFKNDLFLIISDKDKKQIINLELSECCGKLIDSMNENYDRFSYPEELMTSSTIDLNLMWQSSIYSLKTKSSDTPLAIIPIENKNIPYQAVLLNSSTREELKSNWSYTTGVKNLSSVSCTINALEGRCKSSSVTVTKMVNPNIEFLRFGFLFSKDILAPFEMAISQNSNNLATVQISSNVIKVQSSNSEEITLKKEFTTGEWVSGDIFIISDDIHNLIEEDSSISCKNYNDSCYSTQNSQDWMSIVSEKSILRYAYLKKQAVENKVKTDTNTETDSSSSSSKTQYYLYISFKNCIVAKLKINSNSFNKVSVSNRQGSSNLVYWRLKGGVSTSINIPNSYLDNLKTDIPKEIEANTNKN